MAFPENVLTDDEQVVEHLHPHWVTLVPATLWLVVLCVASGIGIAFLPTGTAHGRLVLGVLLLTFLLLCWLTFIPWIRWRTTHYVFTTDRVIIRRGVLRHTGRDIPLVRINDVGFVLSLLDRLVGAGTLTIESAGEQGQERLVNVPRASRVQQTLNRLIEADDERRHSRR
ncbi:MAG: PH domain-containing protein [Actinomycetota bacterium]